MSNVATLKTIQYNKKEILDISKITQEILDNHRSIQISDPEAIPTIVFEFINCMAAYVGKVSTDTGKEVQINFMDLFDIGTTFRTNAEGEKDGNIVPFLNPGTAMDLAVKSDDTTEDEE